MDNEIKKINDTDNVNLGESSTLQQLTQKELQLVTGGAAPMEPILFPCPTCS